MNFNEATKILQSSGYRVLNEMAKAARNRILDRLTPKKKAIYVLSRYYEKNGNNVGDTTLTQLEKYVKAKEPITGLSWDAFKEVLDIDNAIPRGRTNPHLSNTNIRRIVSDNAPLYQNILTTIERSKDNVDRDYVDNIYAFYKATQAGTPPDEAYETYNIGPAIQWLKDDPTEAEDRFGVRWPLIKKALQRWWDDDFGGSEAEAFALFGDWFRAKRANRPLPVLSDDLKRQLVNIAMSDTAVDTYGNMVWTLRRTAAEWLGQSLETYLQEHPEPTPDDSELAAEAEEGDGLPHTADEMAAHRAGGNHRWTIRYIATGDHDVTSVWTEAEDIRSAISQVLHDYHDIEEIISVSRN